MNRNVESRFAERPHVNIGRSKFDLSHSVKTTFDVGEIIPIGAPLEVLPGDTFDEVTSKVIRMQTLKTPLMDNLYCDFYSFFCPTRLVWSHAKEFMGENSSSAWIPTTEYTVPQITSPSGGWANGTIADYFGIPTGISDLSVNALPFRAYALCMDQWFRDQNLCDPLSIPMDETTVTGVNTGTFVTDVAKGGLPYKAAKYHDYFTSALPGPQKGPSVPIPVSATQGTGNAIVYGDGNALRLMSVSAPATQAKFTGNNAIDYSVPYVINNIGTTPTTGEIGLVDKTNLPTGEHTGLVADLSTGGMSLSVGNINDLRLAFQTQKFYEKLALGGSRYTEILRSMFGVTSPDARLQRVEYIGGSRVPLNINQVVQSSATQSQSGLTTTPQGTTAAYSLTADTHHDYTRSFTEHGYIIQVAVVRYDHTYQQGLDRLWTRSKRFDFYWPVFANIGEQIIRNDQIYAQGSSVVNPNTNKPYDVEAFGYQEAWAEYRYRPNIVTGEMRSNYATSLDLWHLGDDYNSLPALSESWIQEDKSNVDRALAVTSSVSNQIFMDVFRKIYATRPMPIFSVPGLIDHH